MRWWFEVFASCQLSFVTCDIITRTVGYKYIYTPQQQQQQQKRKKK